MIENTNKNEECLWVTSSYWTGLRKESELDDMSLETSKLKSKEKISRNNGTEYPKTDKYKGYIICVTGKEEENK